MCLAQGIKNALGHGHVPGGSTSDSATTHDKRISGAPTSSADGNSGVPNRIGWQSQWGCNKCSTWSIKSLEGTRSATSLGSTTSFLGAQVVDRLAAPDAAHNPVIHAFRPTSLGVEDHAPLPRGRGSVGQHVGAYQVLGDPLPQDRQPGDVGRPAAAAEPRYAATHPLWQAPSDGGEMIEIRSNVSETIYPSDGSNAEDVG